MQSILRKLQKDQVKIKNIFNNENIFYAAGKQKRDLSKGKEKKRSISGKHIKHKGL
jgi:hypothetical protein